MYEMMLRWFPFALTILVFLALGISQRPKKKQPPNHSHKKCPAVLKSGERCLRCHGHDGHHETIVSLSIYIGGPYQKYVWIDPSNRVYPVGFFYRS